MAASRDLDLLAALTRAGGVADHATLVAAASRRALARTVTRGLVVRDGWGRYAFPSAEEGRRAAHRLTAVSSHLSAAAHWGWPTKERPDRPWITVPPNRNVAARDQKLLNVSWRTLDPLDLVDGWVTEPVRTVVDCATALPFDEALAVADSALRSGMVRGHDLAQAAAVHPRRGRARVERIARHANGESAGPFESVLRAICLDVPGLDVVPQLEVAGPDFYARVDLGDVRLRIVIEADSFAFHGGREQLRKDCQRYDELVVRGWVVLRFSWEQVMFAPDWVRRVLVDAVAVARSRRIPR